MNILTASERGITSFHPRTLQLDATLEHPTTELYELYRSKTKRQEISPAEIEVMRLAQIDSMLNLAQFFGL